MPTDDSVRGREKAFIQQLDRAQTSDAIAHVKGKLSEADTWIAVETQQLAACGRNEKRGAPIRQKLRDAARRKVHLQQLLSDYSEHLHELETMTPSLASGTEVQAHNSVPLFFHSDDY